MTIFRDPLNFERTAKNRKLFDRHVAGDYIAGTPDHGHCDSLISIALMASSLRSGISLVPAIWIPRILKSPELVSWMYDVH